MVRLSTWLVCSLCLVAAACGTDPQGVDACREIEQARCRRAPSCPELGIPADQVTACIEFTRDQCLHGLATNDPGAPVVDKCASAIENPATSCALVASPQDIAECSFIVPPEEQDAGRVVNPDASAAGLDAD
jgi:hypothetical protein